uniref:Sulfotransferase n=2 Tax=Natrinema halophilum TaxID=1699371 RepID=A0A7D5KCS2_9EURY
MFRSGTTLLARMLDTHEDIVCASDPIRPFYNAVRDSVAAEQSVDFEPYDPLGAYFADEKALGLYDAIQSTTFERTFDRDSEELASRIVDHCEPFSPYIANALGPEHTTGDTFSDVFEQLLAEVPAQYGTGDEAWIGTKEVWTTEFAPAVKDAVPDSKFVLVVRDPRAVCASKYSRDAKYPWLFLARQWRKLALLTHQYATHDERLSDDVLVVRYEDLVTTPEETSRRMCDFLDIELDKSILNPGEFTDGRGEPWIQNTSYEDEEPSFNTDSVRKWEQELNERVVSYIERLCFSEMALFDYEHKYVSETGFTDAELLDPPTIPTDELAEWILAYDGESTAAETTGTLGQEEARHRLLQADDELFASLDSRLHRSFFLEPELAADCRAAVERLTGTNR